MKFRSLKSYDNYKNCWRCVVLTNYERHRCHTHTIARYTGRFSPHLKVKFEFTLVLLTPKLNLVLLNPFFETLDPDQLVSFRSHLIRIHTVCHTNWKYRFKFNRIKFGRSVVHKIFSMIRAKDAVKTLYNVIHYNRIFNIPHKFPWNGSVFIKILSFHQNIHLATPAVTSGNR